MSSGSFGGALSLGGPLAGNAFGGGQTTFGFSIPQGDPGAIESAARAAHSLAQSIRDQGAALRAAAAIALETDGGWGGQAASAYAGYSGHVISVIDSDASGCEAAAGALSTLSRALAEAQAITKQALSDCERYHGEMIAQQQAAAQAAATKTTAAAQASAAAHPAMQAALNKQAEAAGHAQSTAEAAANAAQTEFKAAQQKGQHADQSYQQTARAVTGRLESAAGDMRPAPQVSGGSAVPITVSASDATLASTMLSGAGGLAAAAAALHNPRQLNGLACDNVITPGTALEYIQGFRNKEELAKIAAEDKPLDGSVGGVIPGPPGQFAQGAWDTIKGTGELVWSGVTHPQQVPGAVAGYVAWAAEHPAAFVKSAVDWNDWTHGRPFKAAGELVPALVLAKVGGVQDAWASNPAARPPVVQALGKFAGQVVPHADNAADLVAPLTSHSVNEIAAGARVAPVQVIQAARNSPEQFAAGSARAIDLILKGAGADPGFKRLTEAMSQLPSDPRIVVRPTAPPKVIYRAAPAPAPRMVRRFPRAR